MPVGTIDSYAPPVGLNARDVNKAFLAIKKDETPLFNRIPMGATAHNTKHFWWDDARQIRGTTVTTAYATGTPTALVVASTVGLRAGMYLEIAGRVYKVTSVTNATTLVVAYVAGQALANDTNHAVGSVVNFIGNAAVEGEDYQNSDYTFEVERNNICQIFNDFVRITGTQLAIQREVNDGDLLLQQTQKKLERLYLQLARAAWINPIITAPADNTTGRVMGGIDAYLAANGVNITAATALTSLDDWLLSLDKAGAVLSELWMNPLDLAKFAALDSSKVQLQREDRTRGVFVDRYISKYGHELTLNTDMQAPAGKIRAIRPELIILTPLNGRQFSVQDLDKTGDSEKKLLVGEYTLEVRNSATMGYFVPA